MFAVTAEKAIDAVIDGAYSDGGATASIRGDAVPEHGYMVGGLTDALVVDMEELHPDRREFLWNQVLMYVHRNFGELKHENVFLGSWIDATNGKLYFDVSEWYPYDDIALMVADSRDEIAIWDIANSTEIRTVNA